MPGTQSQITACGSGQLTRRNNTQRALIVRLPITSSSLSKAESTSWYTTFILGFPVR